MKLPFPLRDRIHFCHGNMITHSFYKHKGDLLRVAVFFSPFLVIVWAVGFYFISRILCISVTMPHSTQINQSKLNERSSTNQFWCGPQQQQQRKSLIFCLFSFPQLSFSVRCVWLLLDFPGEPFFFVGKRRLLALMSIKRWLFWRNVVTCRKNDKEFSGGRCIHSMDFANVPNFLGSIEDSRMNFCIFRI